MSPFLVSFIVIEGVYSAAAAVHFLDPGVTWSPQDILRVIDWTEDDDVEVLLVTCHLQSHWLQVAGLLQGCQSLVRVPIS